MNKTIKDIRGMSIERMKWSDNELTTFLNYWDMLGEPPTP